MKKTWLYKRNSTNKSGWWVGWYESGKRKSKRLPNKDLAQHFANIKYQQLNSDIFTGTIAISWPEMTAEYENDKKAQGLSLAALYEIKNTLKQFEETIGFPNSKQITQKLLHAFILERQKAVEKYTVNKDISNLNAFLRWAKKNRYISADLQLQKLKTQILPVKIINDEQIRELLITATLHPGWRIRILLALSTGLRRSDIEAIKINDIHFDRNTITTISKKTGKSFGERPIPPDMTTELSNHLSSLPEGQKTLFSDTFTQKKWNKIRNKAGLSWLRFHDLRKTFASILAQRGVSSSVTQKLLEHSTAELTNKIYTNVDPVLQSSIEKLPIKNWL